jgi:hypothetical protein
LIVLRIRLALDDVSRPGVVVSEGRRRVLIVVVVVGVVAVGLRSRSMKPLIVVTQFLFLEDFILEDFIVGPRVVDLEVRFGRQSQELPLGDQSISVRVGLSVDMLAHPMQLFPLLNRVDDVTEFGDFVLQDRLHFLGVEVSVGVEIVQSKEGLGVKGTLVQVVVLRPHFLQLGSVSRFVDARVISSLLVLLLFLLNEVESDGVVRRMCQLRPELQFFPHFVLLELLPPLLIEGLEVSRGLDDEAMQVCDLKGLRVADVDVVVERVLLLGQFVETIELESLEFVESTADGVINQVQVGCNGP